jgi:hypothetical protein
MDLSNDVKIILAGTNATVGQEREYHTITGHHILHNTSNENWKALIDIAQEKNMLIRSTKFLQKDTQGHLDIRTWTSKEPE